MSDEWDGSGCYCNVNDVPEAAGLACAVTKMHDGTMIQIAQVGFLVAEIWLACLLLLDSHPKSSLPSTNLHSGVSESKLLPSISVEELSAPSNGYRSPHLHSNESILPPEGDLSSHLSWWRAVRRREMVRL